MPTSRSDGLVLAVVVTASIVLLAYSFTVYLGNRENDGYYRLYILDSTKMADQYFPDNDANLTVGTALTWYLHVVNARRAAQTVTIKVKLGNSTLGPHPLECTPASLPSVAEYERALQPEELWELGIVWAITDLEDAQNAVSVTGLSLNGASPALAPVQARDGFNFRLIFELWLHNATTGDPEFGWVQEGQRRCAWTQMWFNVTAPGETP